MSKIGNIFWKPNNNSWKLKTDSRLKERLEKTEEIIEEEIKNFSKAKFVNIVGIKPETSLTAQIRRSNSMIKGRDLENLPSVQADKKDYCTVTSALEIRYGSLYM